MEVWEAMRSFVRREMGNNGVKQKFLAKKCGYGEVGFSLLINGNKTITGADIEKFCAGMGICPNDLFVRMQGTRS